MSQNIQQLEQDLKDAQHKAAAAKAKATAPDTAVTEAMNRLQAAREQAEHEQFQRDIAESGRLGNISIDASRALIAAIEKHDIDGAVKALAEAVGAFNKLASHNWSVLGGDGDMAIFNQLSWGLRPGIAMLGPMQTATANEALARAGVIFVLTGGSDARHFNLPGPDLMQANRQQQWQEFRSRLGYHLP